MTGKPAVKTMLKLWFAIDAFSLTLALSPRRGNEGRTPGGPAALAFVSRGK